VLLAEAEPVLVQVLLADVVIDEVTVEVAVVLGEVRSQR
jgi:hypothetical protein